MRWRRRDAEPGAVAVVGLSLGALASATFAIVALGVLAPKLQDEFGFSNAEVGFLISLVFIGGAITSPRAGVLTDRIGPAAVLGRSLALFTAAMAVAAAAPTVAIFLAGLTIAGFMYGGINPPTNVVVAGRMAQKIGFFLSVKQSGVPLGGLLAGLILPPVAIAFGWRWALAVAVGACAAVAALMPRLRGAAVIGSDDPDHAGSSPLTRRDLAALGLFGFVMSGVQWSVFAHLTVFLTEERAFSLTLAGLALALAQGLGAGARLLWGWLSDIPGRRLTILVMLAAVGATCLAALAAGARGPVLWLTIGIAGVVIIGWNGAYYALIADRAGAGGLGRASANSLVFVFGGTVVLPPLLGLTVDLSDSWRPFWAIAAGAVFLAGAALWVGLRGRELSAVASELPAASRTGE